MVVTIYQGYDNTYIMAGSKNEEFQKRYGDHAVIQSKDVYKGLAEIASWANNELGEECLFEMD